NAFISTSQALQEPVSTSRIVSDRRKGFALSTAYALIVGIAAPLAGYCPVTVPVRRLFFKIRNMASPHSEIIAGIREIEALIDQRKIRDDVADRGPLNRGPIYERRIADFTAVDRAIRAGHHHVENFAAPTFDRAHGPFACLRRTRRGRGDRPG